jgi:enamine deaminase RidA (YjgF/YER057c/UK114 family)
VPARCRRADRRTWESRSAGRQAVDNILEALAEAGAAPEDLLKTTIYVVGEERADLVRAWTVVSERIGRAPSTLLGVSCLGYPDQLVEIEAIARLTPSGHDAGGASARLRRSR